MADDVREFTVTCKSVMTKSKIPSLDYAVNPYLGCRHGCAYCYATFMKKFAGIDDEWGAFVGVKENAPEVLRRELKRKKPGVVNFGTVCDPYQEAEERYRITRACLEGFVDTSGFDVGVLTKSDLVLRDIDVLQKLESPDVGFTVTCLDAGLARTFEPHAPAPARRIAAMRELATAGIRVWGFFGPVLPTFSDDEDSIAEILAEMERAGADRVLVDRMNLYPKVWSRMSSLVVKVFPERIDALRGIRSDAAAYAASLSERIDRVARSIGIEVETCF
jgi:DNA repair photolyase